MEGRCNFFNQTKNTCLTMHKLIYTLVFFCFNIHTASSQFINERKTPANKFQIERIDSLVAGIDKDQRSVMRSFEGRSGIGEYSSKCKVAGDQEISKMVVRFSNKEMPETAFYFSRDSLLLIQFQGSNYYRVGNELISEKEASDPHRELLLKLILFQQEQLELMKVLLK